MSFRRPSTSWLVATVVCYSVLLFAGGHTALPLLAVLPFLIPAGLAGEWTLLACSATGLLGLIMLGASFLRRRESAAFLISALVLLATSAVTAVGVSDAQSLSAISAVPFAVSFVGSIRSGYVAHAHPTV